MVDGASPIRGGVFCHLIGESCGRKNDAEQARQLAPLAVLTTAAHGTGQRFEAPERCDLGLQLVDGARRRGLVQDLCFSGFHLIVRASSRSPMSSASSAGWPEERGHPGRFRNRRDACATRGRTLHPLQQLELAATLLQAFTAAAQGLVDGLGRGRQPSLQDGQRKAHGAGALVVLELRHD